MRSILLVWLFGCVPTYPELADTGSPPDDEQLQEAPVAILVSEGASSIAGDDVVFAVSDANQPASTLYASLTSDLDGVVFEGNPSGNGEVVVASLSVGQHQLLLAVEDMGGLSGELDVEWQVANNPVAPSCSITEPQDGDIFEQGEPVFMSGAGEDPNGGDLTYLWTSSAFGALAFAQEFEGNLPLGEQDLTLTVTNEAGLDCVAVVTVTVQDSAP